MLKFILKASSDDFCFLTLVNIRFQLQICCMFRFEKYFNFLRSYKTNKNMLKCLIFIKSNINSFLYIPFIINVEINVSIKGKTEKLVIKFSFHNLTHPNHTQIQSRLISDRKHQILKIFPSPYMWRKPSEPSVTSTPTSFTSATRKKLSPSSLKLLDLNKRKRQI